MVADPDAMPRTDPRRHAETANLKPKVAQRQRHACKPFDIAAFTKP
jgi:hypothetical protein